MGDRLCADQDNGEEFWCLKSPDPPLVAIVEGQCCSTKDHEQRSDTAEYRSILFRNR